MKVNWSIFRWNSPAYGRVNNKRYPSHKEMIEHRLFGVTFGSVFLGVILMLRPTQGETP